MRKLNWIIAALALTWLASSCATSRSGGGGSATFGAESALEHAFPASTTNQGTLLGLRQFTADRLNQMHQGHELGQLVFVTSEVRSSGPTVISVHIIDDFTWGAAALSNENSRCYVIVLEVNRSHPRFGGLKYGWLPPGAPCLGASATLATASSRTWPDQS